MRLLFLILFIVFFVKANANESEVIYIEAVLSHVNLKSNSVKELAKFKMQQGVMSEVHSNKEYRLLPGGEWDLEIRMPSSEKITVDFVHKNNAQLVRHDINIVRRRPSSKIIFASKSEELRLDVFPKAEKTLEPIEMASTSFGLRDLCFNNTAVIIDDSFYLGRFSGFGERLYFGIPEFYNIDLSLKPLRDWEPIGVLEDGIINIELETGENIELLNVGVGPSGFISPSPFIVYGKIEGSTDSKKDTLTFQEKILKQSYRGEKLKRLLIAKKNNPYVSLSRGTIGNDNEVSQHLIKQVGGIFEGHSCGS
ncbi:hypothetical protein [Kangiella sp. TOML190]|uniref:hypothetical protein n=1 Tax=Kangiella sp. TOML190 TaxID=2931351 RepID=UPI0020401A3D|nr:hypothetical protein [Kangiella sp. TOML190]